MIHEYLLTGADNARTGNELATMLNCHIREVVAQVERERRQGFPICASTRGKYAGYYLASDKEELQDYCRAMNKRAGELHKTRRLLLSVLKQLPDRMTDREQETPAGEPEPTRGSENNRGIYK